MPEDTNMKMCDECGINPANIHLTQIMQNQTQIHHLCQECARKMGINISVNVDESGSGQETTESDKSCDKCGMKYSEFRSKGWLGCTECYQAFEKRSMRCLFRFTVLPPTKANSITYQIPGAKRPLI
jgi:protein-arginine kinase activator protein McsA